jgi:hypothetical protein
MDFVRGIRGSPSPLFETDDDQRLFVICLPCHVLAMGGIAATEQATGDVQRPKRRKAPDLLRDVMPCS